MCTKPFSQTKNKGKLFLVAKSSGPLLARMPLKPCYWPISSFSLQYHFIIIHTDHENEVNDLQGWNAKMFKQIFLNCAIRNTWRAVSRGICAVTFFLHGIKFLRFLCKTKIWCSKNTSKNKGIYKIYKNSTEWNYIPLQALNGMPKSPELPVFCKFYYFVMFECVCAIAVSCLLISFFHMNVNIDQPEWVKVRRISMLIKLPFIESASKRHASGPVVQKLDSAIHRINHYPVDKC